MKRRVKICKCGGMLTAKKFIEVEECETYKEFIRRIEFVKENVLWVHQCNKCLLDKIYQQPQSE